MNLDAINESYTTRYPRFYKGTIVQTALLKINFIPRRFFKIYAYLEQMNNNACDSLREHSFS